MFIVFSGGYWRFLAYSEIDLYTYIEVYPTKNRDHLEVNFNTYMYKSFFISLTRQQLEAYCFTCMCIRLFEYSLI